MASKKHFHVRHGLTAGSGADDTGTPTREVITNTGELVDVGDITTLTTSDTTSVVAAINSLDGASIDDVIALAIALG